MAEEKDEELLKDGFIKVADGVSFPGLNTTEVDAAVEKRKLVLSVEK